MADRLRGFVQRNPRSFRRSRRGPPAAGSAGARRGPPAAGFLLSPHPRAWLVSPGDGPPIGEITRVFDAGEPRAVEQHEEARPAAIENGEALGVFRIFRWRRDN